MMPNRQSVSDAKQGRLVGLVIAITMSLWVLAQWVGPKLGLPGRYALLIDFFAMAAMIWSLVVVFRMWRNRNDSEG